MYQTIGTYSYNTQSYTHTVELQHNQLGYRAVIFDQGKGTAIIFTNINSMYK